MFNPLSANFTKMVKHTQTICRQFADELFACVWPFLWKWHLKGQTLIEMEISVWNELKKLCVIKQNKISGITEEALLIVGVLQNQKRI